MTVAHYLDLRIFATTDDYINITRIKAYHIFSVQYIQIFTRLNKSFKIFWNVLASAYQRLSTLSFGTIRCLIYDKLPTLFSHKTLFFLKKFQCSFVCRKSFQYSFVCRNLFSIHLFVEIFLVSAFVPS